MMKTAALSETFSLRRPPPRHRGLGFTLIEIMIVVAIIGLIAAMEVPSILQTLHKEGMRRAVNDVTELCSAARARAIFQGRTVCIVFHPADKRLEIADAPEGEPMNNSSSTPSPVKTTGSAVLPGSVDIAMLDIDLIDCGGQEEASVCFFPNGTCSELTLVLHSGDEWLKITLEYATALASVSQVTR